jgi:excisionase family DNA binding protein
VILFDPATARDVLDALRLLEGRLIGQGRRLSPGALELREVAEGSQEAWRGGLSPEVVGMADDEAVPHLLTFDEVASRLHVGLTKVKEEARAGALPTVRIGRAVRVHSDDLAEYMDRLRHTNTDAA